MLSIQQVEALLDCKAVGQPSGGLQGNSFEGLACLAKRRMSRSRFSLQAAAQSACSKWRHCRLSGQNSMICMQ